MFRRRFLQTKITILASTGTVLLATACSTAPKSSTASTTTPDPRIVTAEARSNGPEPETLQTLQEVRDQRDAQRIWCNFLEALYHRAMTSPSGPNGSNGPSAPRIWPSRDACLSALTLASPEMLRRTASCSHAALDKHNGDPFTGAYAADVRRCGSAALDAVEANGQDIAPYIKTICGRMAQCGESTYEQCQQKLSAGFTPHLERAIGAMNRRGRNAFAVCLQTLDCNQTGTQIVGCLEPIMQNLLWLPE